MMEPLCCKLKLSHHRELFGDGKVLKIFKKVNLIEVEAVLVGGLEVVKRSHRMDTRTTSNPVHRSPKLSMQAQSKGRSQPF